MSTMPTFGSQKRSDYHMYSVGVENGLKEHERGSSSLFTFRKRTARLDWRKLALVDVDMVAHTVDFNVLQDNIANIAFCSIEAELDTVAIDANFVKLFKLAQLIIGYLLDSQEYLYETISGLESQLRKGAQEHEETKKVVEKLRQDVSHAKKESHKRKKMLAQQQVLLDTGVSNYHKCWQCPKAFINATFLHNHLQRRHSVQAAMPSGGLQPGAATSVLLRGGGSDTAGGQRMVAAGVAALEVELSEMKEQLQLTESRSQEERRALRLTLAKEQAEADKRERDLHEKIDQLQKQRDATHREELQKVQDMFMNELRETNEKYRASEHALSAMRRQIDVRRNSNLGTLKDEDSDLNEERKAMQKQQTDLAKFREQLHLEMEAIKQTMESKLEQQETLWKEKMAALAACHEQELGQASKAASALESKKAQNETMVKDSSKEQHNLTVYKRRIAELEDDAYRKTLMLQQKDNEIELLAQRPPPVAPRRDTDDNWSSSISELVQKRKTLQFEDEKNEANVRKSLELTYGNNSVILPPKTRANLTRSENEDDNSEDEEEEKIDGGDVTESESSNDDSDTDSHGGGRHKTSISHKLNSTNDSLSSGSGLPTGKMSSQMTGEMTNDSKQLTEALLNNPGLISEMRRELPRILDGELSDIGINPKDCLLPTKRFRDMMTNLALRRQQKVKKSKNLHEIRKELDSHVDKLVDKRLQELRSSRTEAAGISKGKRSMSRGSNNNNNGYHTPNSRLSEQPAAMEASRTLSSFGTASSQWLTSTADTTIHSDESVDDRSLKYDTLPTSNGLAGILKDPSNSLDRRATSQPSHSVRGSLAPPGNEQRQPPPRPQRADVPSSQQQQQTLLQQQTQLQHNMQPHAQQRQSLLDASRQPVTASDGGPPQVHVTATAPTVSVEDNWDSDMSDLEEVSPSRMTTSSATVPVQLASSSKGKGVSHLAAVISNKLTSRSLASKPINGVSMLPPSSPRDTRASAASPQSPDIPQMHDDSDDFSLTSSDDRPGGGPLPGPVASTPQRMRLLSTGETEASTNTYGTSVWSHSGGAASLKAAAVVAGSATLPHPGRSSGPTSLTSDAGSLTSVTGNSAAGAGQRSKQDWSDSDLDISEM